MVHVYNERKKVFEQVHYWKVPQRNTNQVYKKQRDVEGMKFLLDLEARHPVKCAYIEVKNKTASELHKK